MLRLLIAVGSCALVVSLKCYFEQNGILSSTSTQSPGSLQECYGGTYYSCIKNVDYTNGRYSKGCSTVNCTNQNLQQISSAVCINTTKTPSYVGEPLISTAVCCCYGDGCNDSHQSGTIPAIIAAITCLGFLQI